MWDATAMLPLANEAYLELQERLSTNQAGVNRSSVVLSNVGASVLFLDGSSTPALPADFILPYGLEERATGTTDQFVEMDEAEEVPLSDVTPMSTRGTWGWYQNRINIQAATVATDIRLEYESRLAIFTTGTDPILIGGALNVLATFTAAACAYSRGSNSLGDRLSGQYEKQANRFLRRHVNRAQYKAGRRIPFSSAHR